MTTIEPHDDAPPVEGPGFNPPQDTLAEQAVLGRMLLDRQKIDDLAQTAKGKHFYRPAHETIYDAVMGLHAAGEPADPITVHRELVRRGEDARCKSPGYLHELVQVALMMPNAEYHAEIVRDRFVARDFLKTTMRATSDLLSGRADTQQVIAEVGAQINAVQEEQAEDGLHQVASSMPGTFQYLKDIAANRGKITGVPTGFQDLDLLTQGLHGGQMIIVAGRPAMGKSTWATDVLRSCSIRHKLPAVLFSLEMGRNEINMKLLSAEARVGLHLMRSGHMDDEDWRRIGRHVSEVNEAPLYVDDSPNLDLTQIRAKARRLREKCDLRLVVIDYLQLLGAGTSRRFESRQAEVSYISRSTKLLAKELDVPIIALSQLNRGPEQRTDRRPMVSDLRESGSLEQDADIVILLHREDAYEKESPRAGEADLIVGKHRGGPTATITVASQLHYSRFVDMAPES